MKPPLIWLIILITHIICVDGLFPGNVDRGKPLGLLTIQAEQFHELSPPVETLSGLSFSNKPFFSSLKMPIAPMPTINEKDELSEDKEAKFSMPRFPDEFSQIIPPFLPTLNTEDDNVDNENFLIDNQSDLKSKTDEFSINGDVDEILINEVEDTIETPAVVQSIENFDEIISNEKTMVRSGNITENDQETPEFFENDDTMNITEFPNTAIESNYKQSLLVQGLSKNSSKIDSPENDNDEYEKTSLEGVENVTINEIPIENSTREPGTEILLTENYKMSTLANSPNETSFDINEISFLKDTRISEEGDDDSFITIPNQNDINILRKIEPLDNLIQTIDNISDEYIITDLPIQLNNNEDFSQTVTDDTINIFENLNQNLIEEINNSDNEKEEELNQSVLPLEILNESENETVLENLIKQPEANDMMNSNDNINIFVESVVPEDYQNNNSIEILQQSGLTKNVENLTANLSDVLYGKDMLFRDLENMSTNIDANGNMINELFSLDNNKNKIDVETVSDLSDILVQPLSDDSLNSFQNETSVLDSKSLSETTPHSDMNHRENFTFILNDDPLSNTSEDIATSVSNVNDNLISNNSMIILGEILDNTTTNPNFGESVQVKVEMGTKLNESEDSMYEYVETKIEEIPLIQLNTTNVNENFEIIDSPTSIDAINNTENYDQNTLQEKNDSYAMKTFPFLNNSTNGNIQKNTTDENENEKVKPDNLLNQTLPLGEMENQQISKIAEIKNISETTDYSDVFDENEITIKIIDNIQIQNITRVENQGFTANSTMDENENITSQVIENAQVAENNDLLGTNENITQSPLKDGDLIIKKIDEDMNEFDIENAISMENPSSLENFEQNDILINENPSGNISLFQYPEDNVQTMERTSQENIEPVEKIQSIESSSVSDQEKPIDRVLSEITQIGNVSAVAENIEQNTSITNNITEFEIYNDLPVQNMEKTEKDIILLDNSKNEINDLMEMKNLKEQNENEEIFLQNTTIPENIVTSNILQNVTLAEERVTSEANSMPVTLESQILNTDSTKVDNTTDFEFFNPLFVTENEIDQAIVPSNEIIPENINTFENVENISFVENLSNNIFLEETKNYNSPPTDIKQIIISENLENNFTSANSLQEIDIMKLSTPEDESEENTTESVQITTQENIIIKDNDVIELSQSNDNNNNIEKNLSITQNMTTSIDFDQVNIITNNTVENSLLSETEAVQSPKNIENKDFENENKNILSGFIENNADSVNIGEISSIQIDELSDNVEKVIENLNTSNNEKINDFSDSLQNKFPQSGVMNITVPESFADLEIRKIELESLKNNIEPAELVNGILPNSKDDLMTIESSNETLKLASGTELSETLEKLEILPYIQDQINNKSIMFERTDVPLKNILENLNRTENAAELELIDAEPKNVKTENEQRNITSSEKPKENIDDSVENQQNYSLQESLADQSVILNNIHQKINQSLTAAKNNLTVPASNTTSEKKSIPLTFMRMYEKFMVMYMANDT